MATYSKKKILPASVSQIPQIAEAIRKDFEIDGFEVNIDSLMSGGRDISVTKGNLFKAVLGMRSALKITLTPQHDGVFFDANVGIYGQQAIAERACVARTSAFATDSQSTSTGTKFCPECGTRVAVSTKFCSECGSKL